MCLVPSFMFSLIFQILCEVISYEECGYIYSKINKNESLICSCAYDVEGILKLTELSSVP